MAFFLQDDKPMQKPDANRRSPRIQFATPLLGLAGGFPVRILDLGMQGAGIEHSAPLALKSRCLLETNDHTLSVRARVTHTNIHRFPSDDQPGLYQSGLEFADLTINQMKSIDEIIVAMVRQTILDWEANATGGRRSELETVRNRSSRISSPPRGYLWCRSVGKTWERTLTRDPNQPIDGFAVCDDEPVDQIELLERAYEHNDDGGRHVLRLMAHLAIDARLRPES